MSNVNKEVVEYIEASNNIIEVQKQTIETLQKEASEKNRKLEEYEKVISENEKQVAPPKEVKASEDEQGPAISSLGEGKKKEITTDGMRKSEQVLCDRFSIPY